MDPIRLKVKLYETVMRPETMYRSEYFGMNIYGRGDNAMVDMWNDYRED